MLSLLYKKNWRINKIQYTNKYKLPDRVIRVIQGKHTDKRPDIGRLSVTDLIDDPLPRILYINHWDDIVRDYSDFLTMTQGTALHDRYEMCATDDEDAEHKFEDAVSDLIVVGKTDSKFDDTILDVKQTGVYGPKYRLDKWTAQLNTYAWQWRRRKEVINKLLIDVWYRDWKLNKVYYKDYPPIPFEVLELKLWTFEEQDEYVRSQVQKHLNHPIFDKPEMYEFPCSDKQRGIRFEGFKGKNKTPSKVGETVEEVQKFVDYQEKITKDKYVIRQSPPVFCKLYCKARSVCPFVENK